MKTTVSSLLTGKSCLAVLTVLFTCSELRTAADSPLAPSILNGVWSGARFSSGAGEDPSQGVKLELTFQGNLVKARRLPDGGEIGEGEFKLSADGKLIDAVGVGKTYKGNTYLGVIKVEGDTLYWCTNSGAGQSRPDKFSAAPNQHTYLIVVKRQP